jgi:hypothetical protein
MSIINLHKPTVEDASAHIFISINRFRQLQREGVLPRANSSDWSIEGIRRRYIENLRAIKANHGPKPYAAKLSKNASDDDDELNLDRERALLAREQRQGHSIKNALARGEVIPAGDVLEGWQSAIARSRSLLLGLPSSAAEEIVLLAPAGPAAVRERLADLVHAALEELANTSVEDDSENPPEPDEEAA